MKWALTLSAAGGEAVQGEGSSISNTFLCFEPLQAYCAEVLMQVGCPTATQHVLAGELLPTSLSSSNSGAGDISCPLGLQPHLYAKTEVENRVKKSNRMISTACYLLQSAARRPASFTCCPPVPFCFVQVVVWRTTKSSPCFAGKGAAPSSLLEELRNCWELPHTHISLSSSSVKWGDLSCRGISVLSKNHSF